MEEVLKLFSNDRKKLDLIGTKFQKFQDTEDLRITVDNMVSEMQFRLRDVESSCERLSEEIKSAQDKKKELEDLVAKEIMNIEMLERLITNKTDEKQALHARKNEFNQRLLRASSKVSVNDLQYLELLKSKLNAYKKLTGVVWDYANCDNDKISGYIRETASPTLKRFTVQIKDKNNEDIIKEIWNICERKCN